MLLCGPPTPSWPLILRGGCPKTLSPGSGLAMRRQGWLQAVADA